MRRGPGIQGIQKGVASRATYKDVGAAANENKREQMKAMMAQFKEKLEEFAQKHREDVRKDPVFRAQFHTMCANVGVDPLASNKGMWTQLLGFGDFYYELGVQIVEACLSTRPYNGGLMDLDSLRSFITKRRGKRVDAVSEDDILRALDKLKVLGGGYGLVTVGTQRLIRSVPGELNRDKNAVLQAAQQQGFISRSKLEQDFGWSTVRMQETLKGLLSEGLAMVDDQGPGGERLYWFPCLAVQGQGALMSAPDQSMDEPPA